MMTMQNNLKIGGKTKVIAITSILMIIIASAYIQPAEAAVTYTIQRQTVRAEINRNGTISLFYSINLTVTGDPQKGIYISMPDGNITNLYAIDGNGNELTSKLESLIKDGKPYQRMAVIWTQVHGDIPKDSIITVNASANIESIDTLFYNDTKENSGNVGIRFIPASWEDIESAMYLSLEILLPEKVNETRLKYSPNVDVIVKDINDKTEVQWIKYQWPSKNNFEVSVSFPSDIVDLSIPLPPETPKPLDLIYWILFFMSIGVVLTIIGESIRRGLRRIRRRQTRRRSTTGRISDSTTVRTIERPPRVLQGLKTAEAATLIDDFDVNKVISIIIYGLCRKGSIVVEERVPELKVRQINNSGLEDYELEVYNAIQNDKRFNKQRLKIAYDNLKRKVQRKMMGYNISETVRSYRDEVEEAWDWTDADKIYVEVTSAN